MTIRSISRYPLRRVCCAFGGLLFVTLPLLSAAALPPRDESDRGLVVIVPAAEADVLQAVKEVANDQIIHGTYVYEKEKTLSGAHPALSSSVFKDQEQVAGKIFYKIAGNVLDPRHFTKSTDLGAITVRYVVQAAGPNSTSLRIDAVFLEDGRHKPHRSDGSVESAEYDAINQHLLEIESKRQKEQSEASTAESRAPQRQDQEQASVVTSEVDAGQRSTAASYPGSSIDQLEQRVAKLRHQVEMRARADGVSLKSAPFRSASTIQALPAHTEVVILILTPYWYGVETADQHRGWIRRSELEPLP